MKKDLNITFTSNSNNSCYRVGVGRIRNYKLDRKNTFYFFNSYGKATAFYNSFN